MTALRFAPDFTLVDDSLNQITLSELKGRPVVLLFFPLAYTRVCTQELCSVSTDLSFYNTLNAVLLGISVDSPFVLSKFKEEYNIHFTLLSDFNKQVSHLYDCIYSDFVHGLKGVSKRAAFVINPEGYIVYEEVLENAGSLPNFDSIKSSLNF